MVFGPSPARDLYLSRIGSALDPRRISTLLTLADQGQPARLHDLLNELRQKDGPLHSVLQTRESALLACGWGVQAPVMPGKKEPTAKARKITALCSEWLGQVTDLERSLAHLMDANYKGYSVCEITWGKRGRYVVPVALHPIQGRRFSFDQTQRLRWYDDGLRPWPGDDFLGKYPYRFVIHQPRINGDNPTREGLGRILVWLSCWSSWSWRDWMLFAELYGKPWRIISVNRDKATEDDVLAAENILTNGMSSNGVLKYDAIDLKIQWPDAPGGASASPAPAILDRAMQHMALAVLGQLGTTGDVQGGLGGRGDAREKVRKDILKADEVALSTTLRHWLLNAIVAINFGPGAPVPTWAFATEDAGDIKGLVQVFKTAKVDLKLRIPEAHVYDVLGIPQPANGERVLGDPLPTDEPAPEADPASEAESNDDPTVAPSTDDEGPA